MKTLLSFFILPLLFLSSLQSQSQVVLSGEDWFFLHPCGEIDSTETGLVSNIGQSFFISGCQNDSTIPPIAGIDVVKNLGDSRPVPPYMSAKFMLDFYSSNVDSVQICLTIGGESIIPEAWTYLWARFLFDLSSETWQSVKWDLRDMSAGSFKSFNRIGFALGVWAETGEKIECRIFLKDFIGIMNNGSTFNIDTNLVVDIKDNNNNQISSDFKLEQNYPNPFNPTTTISFFIPKKDFVILKVFNSLGQEVKTLVNEEKFAGNYEVIFNAVDFPSGVYFYKLQTLNYIETKKMTFLK